MKKLFLLSILLLSACRGIDQPIRPESLVDSSVERLTFSIIDSRSFYQMKNAIKSEMPDTVTISCSKTEHFCKRVIDFLNKQKVKYQMALDQTKDTAILVYNRVIAVDCDQTYLDNGRNPKNQHYSSFGCSNAVNTLHMMSDKKQLVDPSLSDMQDAQKAVGTVNQYLQSK